jgi:hypothetical protein
MKTLLMLLTLTMAFNGYAVEKKSKSALCKNDQYLDSTERLASEGIEALDRDLENKDITRGDYAFALKEIRSSLSSLEKCRPESHKKIQQEISNRL